VEAKGEGDFPASMRLEPLYRIRFDYPESWSVELRGEGGSEEQHLFFAEGTVEGRISGRFRASNFPHRRTDRTFLPNFHGVIEARDGAAVLFECHGFGRPRTPEYDRLSPGRRQWVASVTHLSEHPEYRRLNDVVCVGCGEVRPKAEANPTNPSDLVLDVAELVWEPLSP
jgi:hypothetical protein